MSIPLIDWLNNNQSSTNQGSLIVFPYSLNRWNITSFIVSHLDDYKIVIVTDHSDEFMKILSHDRSSHWTDHELIPFPLIKYSDLPQINRCLNNTEIDIIIFDDARMLSIIMPSLTNSLINLLSDQPKLIILTTWGDNIHQLDVVTKNIPHLSLLTLDIIDDINYIQYHVITTPMSSQQLSYYDKIKVQEFPLYSITKMITLYSYPDDIMNQTLLHKNTCDLQDEAPIIYSFNNDNPKLSAILDGICSNWPNKQIVFTRFNHYYGANLIVSYLKHMIETDTNPYDLNDIFYVSCTDDYQYSMNLYHKFNASESGILITNIFPMLSLTNISAIHIVDDYSFQKNLTLLNRIVKDRSNPLAIYSYLATHPNEKSTDLVLYENFLIKVTKATDLYTGLKSMANKLILDQKNNLLVKY